MEWNSANQGTWGGHLEDTMSESEKEAFIAALQGALVHLYDPAVLLRSPLAKQFGLDQHPDAVAALRSALIQGIEALEPGKDAPPESQAWRVYQVLHYRYAEQLTQREVAHDLGLSIRQLRRQEKQALQVLTAALWRRYDLDLQTLTGSSTPDAPIPPPSSAGSLSLSRQQELTWLRESLPSAPADLQEVVRTALTTVRPLAQAAGVRVDHAWPEDLPPVAVQLGALQQALVNVATAAISSVPGGRIRVEARSGQSDVHVEIRPVGRPGMGLAGGEHITEALDMTKHLIRLFGGDVEVRAGDGQRCPFAVDLSVPAAGQVPVLVIDDNADSLELLQRYLSGTRYRFVGLRDPEKAVSVAIESSCRIVVLDVMLPGVDGWELLGRLRAHPQIQSVPIIVCTILPQERLAMALGAAAFIRKPFSHLDLLATLDRQSQLVSTRSP